MSPRVIEVLRHFLPEVLRGRPSLTPVQWRAIRAITQCRTPALGGHVYACAPCAKSTFAWHSCNHKACPQCGRAATAQWVKRELAKRVQAPYFMVTFTLPSELREMFLGPLAKEAHDLFFAAAAAALRQCLANKKWLGANLSGFTAILHTWNQQLQFHPHLHVIAPAAGIDVSGRVVIGKKDNFLVPVSALRKCFRHHFREALKTTEWEVDPAVWRIDWGVNIQPFGTGENAIKYLGAYVCRTAIGDSRIVSHNDKTVTFRWKNRAKNNRNETMTLAGDEFIRRYLRHVLPRRMHSIRHHGFQHPAAKARREPIAFHSGMPLVLGKTEPNNTNDTNPQESAHKKSGIPDCPCCHRAMIRVGTLRAHRVFLPWPERVPSNKAPPPC